MNDHCDLTGCGICHQTLDDPRILPCIHTFCAKCLEDTFIDNPPNGEGMCPVCQKVFLVPAEGIQGIKKNVLARKLVLMNELSDKLTLSGGTLLCEHCHEEMSESDSEPRPATLYCCQCEQKFCNPCIRYHVIVEDLKDHTVVELGKPLEESLFRSCAIKCYIHRKEIKKVFCKDCNEFICLICVIKDHKGHNHELLDDIDVEDRVLLKRDADMLKDLQTGLCAKEQILRVEIANVEDSKKDIDVAITLRANEIKRQIEKNTQELRVELCEKVRTAVTELTRTLEENKEQQANLNYVIKYSEELVKRGTPYELRDMTGVVLSRSTELQRLNKTHNERPLPKFLGLFEMLQLGKFMESIVGRVFGLEKGRVVCKRAEKCTDGAAGTSGATSLNEGQK